MRWKRSWPDPSERMPFDVLPASNGEFLPPPPTRQELAFMALQEQKGEEVRRRLNMSRRDFVRSSAALAVGLWALKQVNGGGVARADDLCALDNPQAQLANLPGEFIFDIQTHHVDDEGLWKVANPGFHAFFIAIWPQANCGEADRTTCLNRYHYIKEIYMDSSTSMGVLSAVPSSPERNPLPTIEAAETVQLVNQLAESQRAVMHSFVMPNRGSYAGNVYPGVFMQDELNAMTSAAQQYPALRAWKCYTPWGDIPNASGWFHDDRYGRAMIEHILASANLPRVIATHKGFALPSFDQRTAACRDIGIVAREYFDPADPSKTINMIVYHSGFDNETQAAYPGDGAADSAARGVNGLIKSLRENGWSARHFAPGGTPGLAGAGALGDGDPNAHANTPNVYAEIGSTWRSVYRNDVQAAHLLGKLIYYVGPRRVVWGTDSLWYSAPQPEIVALRAFPLTEQARAVLADTYRLPHALDGDVDDPSVNAHEWSNYTPSAPNAGKPGWPTDSQAHPERTIRNGIFGRNAAVPYKVDPDAALGRIECDELTNAQGMAYVQNKGTERETRPMATNKLVGARTPAETLKGTWPNKPWAP